MKKKLFAKLKIRIDGISSLTKTNLVVMFAQIFSINF